MSQTSFCKAIFHANMARYDSIINNNNDNSPSLNPQHSLYYYYYSFVIVQTQQHYTDGMYVEEYAFD